MMFPGDAQHPWIAATGLALELVLISASQVHDWDDPNFSDFLLNTELSLQFTASTVGGLHGGSRAGSSFLTLHASPSHVLQLWTG